jgi:hypothetical protein
VTFAEKQLWTTLYLGTRQNKVAKLTSLRKLLQFWHEMSRDTRLIISIQIEDEQRLHSRIRWGVIAEQLSQLFGHCDRLEIGAIPEALWKAIAASHSIQELVLLRALTDRFDERVVHRIFADGSLLRLRALECYRTGGLTQRLFFDLWSTTPDRLASLRQLAIATTLDWERFLKIISACPKLEKLHVAIEGLHHSRPITDPISSNLRELQITIISKHESDHQSSACMMAKLAFPELKRLLLRVQAFLFSVHPSGSDIASQRKKRIFDSIALMISNAKSRIEYLELSWDTTGDTRGGLDLTTQDESYRILLNSCSSLRSLKIYAVPTEEVLRSIIPLTSTDLCPQLDTLALEMIDWSKTANGMPMEMMAKVLVTYLRKMATKGEGYVDSGRKSLMRIVLVRRNRPGCATDVFYRLLSSHRDLQGIIGGGFVVKLAGLEFLQHERLDEDMDLDDETL